LAERKVEIQEGNYEAFTRVIEQRTWDKLIKRANHYDELIVREFYANAYPLMQKYEKARSCWVQGKKVLYDRDKIMELPRASGATFEKERNFIV